MKEFMSFDQYDNWYWHHTGNHATIEQYANAKARYNNIARKAAELCRK